jgi:hypothetical protein
VVLLKAKKHSAVKRLVCEVSLHILELVEGVESRQSSSERIVGQTTDDQKK